MDAYVLRTSAHPRSSLLIDVSDNSARGKIVAKLIAAASSTSPTAHPGIAAWSAPAVIADPQHALGATAGRSHAEAIADVWQQLNSLRVMAQYTRTLGVMCEHHPFLHAHPSTCVIGLEWLSRFVQPIQEPAQDVRDSLEQSVEMFRQAQQRALGPTASAITRERATFDYHSRLTCSDRDVTRILIAQHFPTMECKEYHVDVCAYMLTRGIGMAYDDWLSAFPAWRDTGLLFPLALSAAYMPRVEAWLPEDKLDTSFAITFQRCLDTLGRPDVDPAPALKAMAAVWAADSTGSAHLIAVTLDRVAVLMGVKSNGSGPGEFSLAAALAAFPRSFGDPDAGMHECNYRAWHAIRAAVEATFPPSLLLAPCVRPKRPTWGHPSLTIEVATEGLLPSVRFAETALQVVAPDGCSTTEATFVKVDRWANSAISPSFHRDCLLNQTSFRIQDVLWRLGEIATSPGVAACMLRPRDAKAALEGRAAPQPMNRRTALLGMPSVAPPAAGLRVDPDYVAYAKALDATVPQVYVTHFPETQSALMWRLDIPSRAIIYIGAGPDEVDPAAESQHHLRKVLVNSKVPQRPIGGIVQVPPRSDESAIRECVRQFAASELAGHPANTVLVKAGDGDGEDAEDGGVGARQVTPVTCTTLAESAACFALRAPSRLTTCPLGGSCSWKENGIDPRYAERQQAQNGARYRDWVAMHAGRGGTQQSRLASHFVEYDSLYTTKMPWVQQHDDRQTVRWVSVSSTAPPDSKTLHGKTLRQAVEGRFLHDLRMLPAHDIPGGGGRPKIERSNAEIYAADDGAKVAVAYAPTGQDRIEFVAFECDAPQ